MSTLTDDQLWTAYDQSMRKTSLSSRSYTEELIIALSAVADAAVVATIPEGWMRDRLEVENLADNLESIAWQPDFYGEIVCVDQAVAMSARVIRKVLLPMLEAAKEYK